jgi:hypothetical protein
VGYLAVGVGLKEVSPEVAPGMGLADKYKIVHEEY